MMLFIYYCCHMAIGGNIPMALGLAIIPAVIALFLGCLHYPNMVLAAAFVFNYIIMGLGRYVYLSIPITVMFEMFFALIIICYMIRHVGKPSDDSKAINWYWFFMFLWMAYCIINIGNGVTGRLRVMEWYKAVRPIAFYPLIVSIIVALHAKRYQFIRYFLILWGIMIMLATAKGYWQRSHGFDTAEWIWLMTRGASTHLINTGVRYFSFFTDAANYGCSMGMSGVTFAITALHTKSLRMKIFYGVVALCAAYGMLISGTRAALAVPIVGVAMYTVLCKNVKIFFASAITLCAATFILAFTTIGDSNKMVHRMRTAFDKEDASMNVRYENQKAIKAYMSEAPFGIGLGLDAMNVSQKNKFYLPAATPADSDWVNIWVRMGEIGLGVFLLLQAVILATASFILCFRIKNEEIRGPLVGMLCGCGGILIASYGNMVYFQYPNGPIIYACLTLVFMGTYFDQQYSKDHDIAKA
jgi:hypothetical protein